MSLGTGQTVLNGFQVLYIHYHFHHLEGNLDPDSYRYLLSS